MYKGSGLSRFSAVHAVFPLYGRVTCAMCGACVLQVRESVEGDRIEGPSEEALRDAEARVQDAEEELKIWHYTANVEERGG